MGEGEIQGREERLGERRGEGGDRVCAGDIIKFSNPKLKSH